MKPAFALHFETSRDRRGRWSLSKIRAVQVLDVVTLGGAGAFAEIDAGERDRDGRKVTRVVPRCELLSLFSLENLSGAPAEKSALPEMAGAVAP